MASDCLQPAAWQQGPGRCALASCGVVRMALRPWELLPVTPRVIGSLGFCRELKVRPWQCPTESHLPATRGKGASLSDPAVFGLALFLFFASFRSVLVLPGFEDVGEVYPLFPQLK